jgi:hypothetical protein
MSFVGDPEEGTGFEVETENVPEQRVNAPHKDMWRTHCSGGSCVKVVIDEKGVCTSCWSPHGEAHHRGCGQNPERVLPPEEVLDEVIPPEVQPEAQGAIS